MLWTAIRQALCRPPRRLVIGPGDLASVDALCGCIGEQAASLLPHLALYVYWATPGQAYLELRTLLLAAAPPLPAPDYAGLVHDSCVTPVPITLAAGRLTDGPHAWSGGGERWLDLAVRPFLLLRFRLRPDHAPDSSQLERLNGWLRANREALTLIQPLLPQP